MKGHMFRSGAGKVAESVNRAKQQNIKIDGLKIIHGAHLIRMRAAD